MNLRSHISETFKLALPVMLTNLGHVAMGVTDNIIVGHIDAISLAAAGLALVIFNVLLLFGIGVSYAITPLVAEAHGTNDPDKVVAIVRHGFVINVINSILLALVVTFGKQALYYLNQPEEVVALSIPFLTVITWSLVPVMIFQTFKQFAEGLSLTRVAMFVMIATNILNLLLNYTFVYGHFGVDPMGLQGSAWATFFSRIAMALLIILYVTKDKQFSIYKNIFAIGEYTKALFRRMLNIGVPSGAQFIFEVAAFDFSLVMMGWLGAKVLAAHQIAINLATISYMTTAGLAAAATVRVGYFRGRKDPVNMQVAAYVTLSLALLIMTCWAVFFIFGREWLPSLYVNDTQVQSIAASLLIIAGLFQLADGAQVVCASGLRALEDVKVPSLLIFISYWMIGLPLGYYFTFVRQSGATGVWVGLLTGLTLTAIALFLRFRLLLKKASRSMLT